MCVVLHVLGILPIHTMYRMSQWRGVGMVSGEDNGTSPVSLGGHSSALQPTSDNREQAPLATVCPNLLLL